MDWLHYLLEANIYLAVFYAGYCLLLNKETHYTLNRVYLLLSCGASFILPVIQISSLKPAAPIAPVGMTYIVNKTADKQTDTVYQINWPDVLWCVYIIGIAVMLLLLVIKLFRLINMTTSGKRVFDNRYKLIDIEDTNTAFSFFNYLFIGTKVKGNDTIIRHELVHIRQKHSLDIIFIEVLKVINWFNPLIYLLQTSIKTVHEYIADEQTAAQEGDALTYSSFLVNNAYGLSGSSVTHSFFNYNLLKKRIIMLNQQRSGKLARLKYLVAVPICAGMLCASTLAFSKNYAFIDLAPKTAKPTVIAKTATTDTSTRKMRTRATTSKGYAYDETGFLINSKTDFRVVITDKSGDQKAYFKSKASATELAMLKDKYGYSFPKMMIFPKLPPPPPMPPVAQAGTDKMPPPPPPAPSKHGAKNMRLAAPVVSMDMNKMPPPPPPAAPVVSRDINKMPPPPPPAPLVASRNINKMPLPPPPAPPISSKDVIEIPAAMQPVAPKRVKMLKLKPVPNVDIVIEAPVTPETAIPATAPTDPTLQHRR